MDGAVERELAEIEAELLERVDTGRDCAPLFQRQIELVGKVILPELPPGDPREPNYAFASALDVRRITSAPRQTPPEAA